MKSKGGKCSVNEKRKDRPTQPARHCPVAERGVALQSESNENDEDGDDYDNARHCTAMELVVSGGNATSHHSPGHVLYLQQKRKHNYMSITGHYVYRPFVLEFVVRVLLTSAPYNAGSIIKPTAN